MAENISGIASKNDERACNPGTDLCSHMNLSVPPRLCGE